MGAVASSLYASTNASDFPLSPEVSKPSELEVAHNEIRDLRLAIEQRDLDLLSLEQQLSKASSSSNSEKISEFVFCVDHLFTAIRKLNAATRARDGERTVNQQSDKRHHEPGLHFAFREYRMVAV